jgi:hypothetical protein
VARPYSAGDWFAIPLRFRLFAVGRAAAVDAGGAILGYFFARFFERVPSGSDVLAFSPGDADLIGVCDEHGLRSGEWPLIAHASDPRLWSIPVFRTFDPQTGAMRWSTFAAADLSTEIVFEHEPRVAGVRNWGLSMLALHAAPMSWAAVESVVWQRFRAFQTTMHRKYIADMQRGITTRVS